MTTGTREVGLRSWNEANHRCHDLVGLSFTRSHLFTPRYPANGRIPFITCVTSLFLLSSVCYSGSPTALLSLHIHRLCDSLSWPAIEVTFIRRLSVIVLCMLLPFLDAYLLPSFCCSIICRQTCTVVCIPSFRLPSSFPLLLRFSALTSSLHISNTAVETIPLVTTPIPLFV